MFATDYWTAALSFSENTWGGVRPVGKGVWLVGRDGIEAVEADNLVLASATASAVESPAAESSSSSSSSSVVREVQRAVLLKKKEAANAAATSDWSLEGPGLLASPIRRPHEGSQH